jgi:hypothetical protein
VLDNRYFVSAALGRIEALVGTLRQSGSP